MSSERVADVLPLRPANAAGAEPQPAVRAHAREDKPKPQRPPRTRMVAGVLTGTDPLAKGPPAVFAVWAQHKAAAEFYESPLVRYPRYLYGAVHAWVVVPLLYLLAWFTDSPPKVIGTAAVVLSSLWFTHLL
jgi:hypothetical protein